MGRAKEAMMKWDELGCRPVGDKNICPECVGDKALRRFITQHAKHQACDYCDRTFELPTCAEADELIEFIAHSISYEYEDPVHSVGYCTAEGGWLLPVRSSDDLVCDFDLGEFSEDAANALSGSSWVEKDPYGDRPEEHLLSTWGAFAHHVKHQQRFFFPRNASADAEVPNASILETVGTVATEAALIRVLPIGTELFRARQHEASRPICTANELGTPPPAAAGFSNRMSPAGIPMFYAAKDATTARAETETSDPAKRKLTIGTFATTRELRLLDLAAPPAVPSLFDEERRHLRTGIKFTREFADDLALPIQRNGQEHIDYVPTQLVSEYFRTEFKTEDGGALDGICYRSAKHAGGVCVCLFLTHADFTGTGSRSGDVPALRDRQTLDL